MSSLVVVVVVYSSGHWAHCNVLSSIFCWDSDKAFVPYFFMLGWFFWGWPNFYLVMDRVHPPKSLKVQQVKWRQKWGLLNKIIIFNATYQTYFWTDFGYYLKFNFDRSVTKYSRDLAWHIPGRSHSLNTIGWSPQEFSVLLTTENILDFSLLP